MNATIILPRDMTERDFQALVVQLAKLRGWLTYHTYDSRRSDEGFPDLVMVRDDRVLFIELKQERRNRKASAVQQKWLDNLTAAGQEVYLWRPSDWPTITKTLAR